jgi:acetyl/propionyl-CoA carboxylase alpha subunit
MQHEFVIRSRQLGIPALRYKWNAGALALPPDNAQPIRILRREANGAMVVLWGERVISGIVTRGERGEGLFLNVDGDVYELSVREAMLDEMEQGLSASGPGSGAVEVRSPIPGLVKNVLVNTGDAVTAGQTLVVLEAMKMENEITALHAGTVETVEANPGQAVSAGALLVVLKT